MVFAEIQPSDWDDFRDKDPDHHIHPTPEPSFYGAFLLGFIMMFVAFRGLSKDKKVAQWAK